MISDESVLRTRSATTCPVSTAELVMGKDLKRSMMPFFRSFATESEVVVAPNAAICTRIPATRKFTYTMPPVLMAPPNT
ncbi:MAG TPA: hypothetical protein PLT07_08640 [Trueperaceae bacterium]|nr:hypothetical protein [Trueperaceae bacterium]